MSKDCRLGALVFALFFCSYALFLNGYPNANTNSRAGLTANFVQHGRLDINGYDRLSQDKAYYQGNYYGDKAPGMSFLAMPAAGLAICLKREETRLAGVLIALIAVWYPLLKAGYVYWEGGWSTGPRHITPVYPFLALALGLSWPHFSGLIRRVAAGLLGLSVLISLAVPP
jgi:hypothetical protein